MKFQIYLTAKQRLEKKNKTSLRFLVRQLGSFFPLVRQDVVSDT